LQSYQDAINAQADRKEHWCVLAVSNEFSKLQDNHNTWFAATLLLGKRDNKESTNFLAAAFGSMNSPTNDGLNNSLVLAAGLDYVCKISHRDKEYSNQKPGDCTMLVVYIFSVLKILKQVYISLENLGGIAGCKCYVTASEVTGFKCVISNAEPTMSLKRVLTLTKNQKNKVTSDMCESYYSKNSLDKYYQLYFVDQDYINTRKRPVSLVSRLYD
jgi:hypothetical protein